MFIGTNFVTTFVHDLQTSAAFHANPFTITFSNIYNMILFVPLTTHVPDNAKYVSTIYIWITSICEVIQNYYLKSDYYYL